MKTTALIATLLILGLVAPRTVRACDDINACDSGYSDNGYGNNDYAPDLPLTYRQQIVFERMQKQYAAAFTKCESKLRERIQQLAQVEFTNRRLFVTAPDIEGWPEASFWYPHDVPARVRCDVSVVDADPNNQRQLAHYVFWIKSGCHIAGRILKEAPNGDLEP